MSDDHDHRSHRSSDSIARSGQGRGSRTGTDPLAELARLIGQTDPFGDAVNASARLAESAGAPPAVDWTAPSAQPQQSFAPQDFSPAPAYGHSDQQGLYEVEPSVPSYLTQRAAAPAVDAPAYHPAGDYGAEQQDFYDEAPSGRRRIGVIAVAALFGLAVLGTAGAFGYRALFGGSGPQVPPVIKADAGPLKVVPSRAEAKKAVTDRVGDATEKIVPREEKPVDIGEKIAAAAAASPAAVEAPPRPPMGNGILSNEPKKVHTIVIRPDGSEAEQSLASPMPPQAVPAASAAPVPPPAPPPSQPTVNPPPPKAAAVPAPAARPVPAAHEPAPKPVQQVSARAQTSANAPLSLSPTAEPAPRSPVRTANAVPTSLAAPAAAPVQHASGGYAVQVSSQRSEAEARTAFHALQTKFAKQLGSQPMFVHKVDLGSKGIYYRTMVGPFASASEAAGLCSSLKSAGGSCLVQKN